MKRIIIFMATVMVMIITGCSVKPPSDIKPIDDFELSRYLGRWYEIARIDNWFEKGLSHVSANYSMRDDGGIKVVNQGFNQSSGKWKQSIGKAYFVSTPNIAALKVSFFGPFYGGYNIIKLDKDYMYALVVGPSKDYLWILSRTPTIDSKTQHEYLMAAEQNGFDISRISWTKQ